MTTTTRTLDSRGRTGAYTADELRALDALADGIGGSARGKFASALAIETIARDVRAA